MKSIELFAGAGGLGIGLHQAGFHPVSVLEWDRHACDTIRLNQVGGQGIVRSWPLIEGDVRDVTFRQLEGAVDLVSGGPPCQPFSLGGKHRAHADDRDMFPEAVRAVREVKPRAFIFENVKGLTRESFRNYFEYIRLQMEHPELRARRNDDWRSHLARLERHHTRGRRDGLHYRVVTRLLNAADYGVPQRRERVVFVGIRDDLNVAWQFPTPTHSRAALDWDQLHGDYWERNRVPRKERSAQAASPRLELVGETSLLPWCTVREAIADLPEPESAESGITVPNHRLQLGARIYPGHTGSPLDQPAKTLKAGVHGVPGGENMLVKSDGSVRYFTIRESARLQTFPDDFTFHGSWTESMRQLGNAVPVMLARRIGEELFQHLTSKV